MLDRIKSRLESLQQMLEALYQLETGPCVCDFVQLDLDNAPETLLVRHSSPELLELRLVLPQSIDPEARTTSEDHLEMVEGVSHFVHIVERARTGLPTTQLELELQAEVDKLALLRQLDPTTSARALHEALYERVAYLHPANTEKGQRYRLANQLAARFWSSLLKSKDPQRLERRLRCFYRAGQAGKIRLAHAP